MKYSITVLQAEITKFENVIKAINRFIKTSVNLKDKPEVIEQNKRNVKEYEKDIAELKADIKKL